MTPLPPDPRWFGDYQLIEDDMAQFENPYSRPDYADRKNPNRKEIEVETISAILRNTVAGGWLKGYRTQVIGVTGAIAAFGLWLVGDISFTTMMVGVGNGLAWTALGAKVNELAKGLGLKVEIGKGIEPPKA